MSHKFGDIEFKELDPQRVICSRIISAEPEEDSMRTVQNWLVQHGLDPEGRRSFGFDSAVSQAEADAGLRGYEVGYVVPEEVNADDGVQNRIYGGGMYAVMRIYNAFEAPFEAIPAGWQHLMEEIKKTPEWQPTWSLCYEEVAKGETGTDLILYHHVKHRD